MWIRCYWLLADPVLPTHCTRQGTAERMRLGAALRLGGSKELLDQWHRDLRLDMFMRGLRLNKQIVAASSVTRLTTKTMKLQPPCPQPLPELKPRPDHVASSVEEIIQKARSQLEVYQGGRGVLMNLPDLTWAAATASPLPTPDDISLISLFRPRRLGDWDADHEVRWLRMHARHPRAFNTVSALREALRAGGSHATSVDDLPLSLLRPFPYAGHVALWRYLNVPRTAPQALSNTAVQLGIEEKGHPWLFCSYRPIKMGSRVNRLEASAVHRETMYRADMAGDFDGRTFSYRKEISPHHMVFSLRASVVLALQQAAEAHIVDADESGAFDTPIREDVARLSQLWSTQCAFGEWACRFYPHQNVRLFTIAGWPPLSPHAKAFPRDVYSLPRAITCWVRSGHARPSVGLRSGSSSMQV